YQAQLQKNLMYLAAMPDAQPQTPALPPQMAPHPSMQQGFYMQYPRAATVAQQPGEVMLHIQPFGPYSLHPWKYWSMMNREF
ncbi:GRF1-interacting factor 3, partial [Trifolium medium]|nr:GRF1-interacting factor 3 [Trifolium medium]